MFEQERIGALLFLKKKVRNFVRLDLGAQFRVFKNPRQIPPKLCESGLLRRDAVIKGNSDLYQRVHQAALSILAMSNTTGIHCALGLSRL